MGAHSATPPSTDGFEDLTKGSKHMADHTFVVFTKPVAGKEAEYNRWYDEQHLPDVLQVPGVVNARRFLATDAEGNKQYLALYGLQTDNPDALLADLNSRAGSDRMVMSDALDMESINAVIYSAITPLVTL